MSDYILAGNYLSPGGEPVLATQSPGPNENHMGSGRVWVSRWIVSAAPDAIISAGAELAWGHSGERFTAHPREWIVWDTRHFKVVPDLAFKAGYAPIEFKIEAAKEPTK